MGEPLPSDFAEEEASPVGDTSVWLIEGEPRRSRVLRTVALVAAMVQERLWITDPYFVAPGAVAEAMVEAAQSGVDVRVLVPANNNWPLVGDAFARGLPVLARTGRATLRMARGDDSREDLRRGRTLVQSGLEQPQCVESSGELGDRRGRFGCVVGGAA